MIDIKCKNVSVHHPVATVNHPNIETFNNYAQTTGERRWIMSFKCNRCGARIADGQVGPCPFCGNEQIARVDETLFRQTWDQYPLNPYAVTLSSGSATLSSSAVITYFPDTWDSFKIWSKEKKTSDIPVGNEEERIALLYCGQTQRIMEDFATYVATKLNYTVVTAPNIYEKGTGKRIAFQPRPKESLNQFIKRFIGESKHVIILYTEQGGQIIETSFCSDMNKHTLGLVNFYRGRGGPEEGETLCPFFKTEAQLSRCICSANDAYDGKVCGYICSASEIFCPFTQQAFTKMLFDFYITSPNMFLFGSENIENLKKIITPFLRGQIK